MTSRQFVPMDPVEPRMTTRRRKSDLEALAWDAGTHHPEKSQEAIGITRGCREFLWPQGNGYCSHAPVTVAT